MPSPLIIPGVQVTALFEPQPVLPGAIGILGVVGVTDRGPTAPTGVGNMSEFLDLFGPASRFTMPEVRTAFTNGVAEVVVARVDSTAARAELTLKDDDDEPVVVLRARAEGLWGNALEARITQVKTSTGTVKYVNVDLYLGNDVVESFNGLVMDEESQNYLFDRINQQSRLVVAYDPQFDVNPPKSITSTFNTTSSAASNKLVSGATDAFTVTAKTAGRAGNKISIAVLAGSGPTKRNIQVRQDGVDPVAYPDQEATDIAGIADPLVTFSQIGSGTAKLPDISAVRLEHGRDASPGLLLLDDPAASKPKAMAELLPASAAVNAAQIALVTGTDNRMSIAVRVAGEQLESFSGLTMDPDDPRYLVDVLRQSKTLRARDLAERSLSNTLPKDTGGTQPLIGGAMVKIDDYTAALDRLELAEEVDMVIASTALQLDNAKALKVQQAVVAHCTKMGDLARNRIGLGSIFEIENTDIAKILDHADDVRSDHFILTAPAGTEASLAGLLGRLDYFRSPTFKPIATVDAPLVPYTDTQLSKLITANLAVIAKRTGLGIVTVKGLLTSSRQINVQRTADVAVRRVKAIADRFIGLLNDDGTRNALRQQIIAMFLQMELDGAVVPSVDGTRPAFTAAVYSSPNDFATGIVRIDIALLPVHAIDYIYATLLVQN